MLSFLMSPVLYVSLQASGGAESVNVWERPWSVDEMRKAANDWSLAGDAGVSSFNR